MTVPHRETWLNQLAAMMSGRFEELGYPIPPFRVAIGFTSRGKTMKVGGECWHSNQSADRKFEILVSPILDDDMQVAAVLAHELCHAAAGFKHKHRGKFAELMHALGMVAPMTQSNAGPEFKAWCQPFLDHLGHIPHARLSWGPTASPVPKGEDGEEGEGEDDDGEGGSSNDKPKQKTRMLKATCENCAYTVRLSKKWAEKLGAVCPEHGPMDIAT